MKISRNWLLDYIDIASYSDVEIAESLTRSGIEVEDVYKLADYQNVVVGVVTSVKSHPNADNLKVCMIDFGSGEETQVVCGASNVREFAKVAYAKVGCTINGKLIEEIEIREVKSSGMLCSLEELGIDSSFLDDKDVDGIIILPSSAELGQNVFDFLKINDTIFDLGLTPNRSDCLSIVGVANELSAVLNIPMIPRVLNYPKVENDNPMLNLLVSSDKVEYFSLIPLHYLKVKESPDFIKSRLIASGIKPINNIVDITNYVLIETGQPMHAFDLHKSGLEFEVRSGFKGEKIITLDEKEVTLTPNDIVVSNQDKPLSIAGVMGGFETRVTKYTTDIILECALFESNSIRHTSKRSQIRSESSVRFEKGINPDVCELAMKMAVSLLIEHADAKLSTNAVVYDNVDKSTKPAIELEYSKLTKYVGHTIDIEEITDILKRLQFSFKYDNGKFFVNRTSRRQDVTTDVCVIEEIVRIYGLDKIEPILPRLSVKKSFVQEYDYVTFGVKNTMHSLGYNECISYTLTSKKKAMINLQDNEKLISLLNPLSSEREYLRKSLIPSLIETASYNITREIEDVKLFELSNVYYYLNDKEVSRRKLAAIINDFSTDLPLHGVTIKSNFFLLKGSLEKIMAMANLLEGVDYDVVPSNNLPEIFHPYQSAKIQSNGNTIGYIGKIHPNYSKHNLFAFEIDFDEVKKLIDVDFKLESVPSFPSIKRDLSIVLPNETKAIDVISEIRKMNIEILEDTTLYNVYTDEKLGDSKSITLRFKFRSENCTLSDNEVSTEMDKIINILKEKFDGDLR